jgi:predicted DNA-binding protein
MRERTPYETITFKTTPEMRDKIKDLMRETGESASTIVQKCIEYALTRIKLRATKKEIFFE